MKIIVPHDLDLKAGTYDSTTADDVVITLDFTVEARAEPPVAEPPPVVVTPPVGGLAGQKVTVIYTGADGLPYAQVVTPGTRVPLVATQPLMGSVVYHADGLSVCIENRYAGLTGDLSGAFRLTVGGTVLFDGELTIWAYKRSRPFWLAQPKLKANPDLSAFPKYGPGSENTSVAAAYAKADNSPMGIGLAYPRMGTQGERDDLGPVPRWDACAIVNPTPGNLAVVRGMSDAAAPMLNGVIDPKTQKMIDVTQYPKLSMLDVYVGIAGNPITKFTSACPTSLTGAKAHATNYCALACELYGTDYDREELASWCNYVNSIWDNYTYKTPSKGPRSSGASRAVGRGLVVLLYAAKYCTEWADYFNRWLVDLAADMSTRYLSQTGIHINQTTDVYAEPGKPFAPWMEDILVYGVGLAVAHGRTEFQPSLDYLAVTTLDRMLAAQHEFAVIYNTPRVAASGAMVADWNASLAANAALHPAMAAALACAEDSAELQIADQRDAQYVAGDFGGYPWAADGYPAMMQPALAMVAKHATDQVRAKAAWAKFRQYARCDYSANPKYNVVP